MQIPLGNFKIEQGRLLQSIEGLPDIAQWNWMKLKSSPLAMSQIRNAICICGFQMPCCQKGLMLCGHGALSIRRILYGKKCEKTVCLMGEALVSILEMLQKFFYSG